MKEIDITSLLLEAGIASDKVSIIETEGMYPYKENIENNWAFYTAFGLKRLKAKLLDEGKGVETVAIVGIGSGVEGIIAEYLFQPEIKKLIVTDVDDEVANGAIKNIATTAEKFHTETVSLVGSLCEPISNADYMVDVVHANIPNLPVHDEDITKGAEKGTFLKSSLYESYNPPEEFVSWAMGAQFAYLQSARKILNDGSTVVTELGGRMPFALIKKLFDECGLGFEELYVGFKEQTEAVIDFIGYHRIEEQYGTSFEFYLLEEGRKALHEVGHTNANPTLTGQQVKDVLEPYKVSAGKALELYNQGVAIGHTVHILRGVK